MTDSFNRRLADDRDRRRRPFHSGRGALVGSRAQGPDHPHRRQRRPAGGRHALLSRRRLRRALLEPGHDARSRAAPMSASARSIVSNEGNVMLTVDGRHLRPPRHLGRRLLLREQHRALRPRRRVPARLPRQLRARGRPKHGMSKRDIVPNINFFMNVPIKPNGEMTIVDGISGPGDYVELRRRDGRALRHLQLPAGQQSLQRLQPDADPRADLGRPPERR